MNEDSLAATQKRGKCKQNLQIAASEYNNSIHNSGVSSASEHLRTGRAKKRGGMIFALS